MSDLHLNKKPWQVRKALQMGRDADIVLLVGDLVNEGTPEQIELMHKCLAEVLPDTPVLAVAGNHDYPRQPSPMIREGIRDYQALQDWLLVRSGHTHVAMESPIPCVEHDAVRNHIYINDGSIRPTTLLQDDGKPTAEPADGNVVELLLDGDQITLTAISAVDGEPLPDIHYCYQKTS